MKARVLVLGTGGREHAIAWKLAQSTSVETVIAAPGNPGMSSVATLTDIDLSDTEQTVRTVRSIEPDLVVIGPEAPIEAGLADLLREKGYVTFAPSRAAARLEWDKPFAKDFMQRHNIPTAEYQSFDSSEVDAAVTFVENHRLPVVVKAAGLAAGKGVVICETTDEARQAVREMLSGEKFGNAGAEVVVEEFMSGEEASVFVVSDGDDYLVLAPSQDHKRVGDGDTGPNTGGMGAYAPAPVVTDALFSAVREQIIEPTLRGMKDEGTPYVGCLYVGLMIDPEGQPRVVEFNSRFGDPEAQVVLPIWPGDLYTLFRSAAKGKLDDSLKSVQSAGTAACVVMASGGYPGSYEKGKPVSGLDSLPDDVVAFHAGTALRDGEIVTAGGRVLGVTAISPENDLAFTIRRAYEGVRKIAFQGAIWRRDIGYKATGHVTSDLDTNQPAT